MDTIICKYCKTTLNGTGDTVLACDNEVERRIVKLNDYIIQHNYCIKELTEMVMDLDRRMKQLERMV